MRVHINDATWYTAASCTYYFRVYDSGEYLFSTLVQLLSTRCLLATGIYSATVLYHGDTVLLLARNW